MILFWVSGIVWVPSWSLERLHPSRTQTEFPDIKLHHPRQKGVGS
jgi:hypothetical protein